MSVTVDEVHRTVAAHGMRLDSHSSDIQELQLWRAKVQGFLLALTIFASLPTLVLGWMALTNK